MIQLITDFSNETEKKKLYGILKSVKPVKYLVKLSKYRKQRSMPQNKYYWGVVLEILSDCTGFTPEEMHHVLKAKFNPVQKTFKATGETFLMGKSTTELNTEEMEKYLEQIRIFAVQELDCLIPLPNETL